MEVGNLTLFPADFKCRWKGNPVKLTISEFSLLFALARVPGEVKTRNQLIDEAFGSDYTGYDRTIDSFIKRIRLNMKALDPEFAQIEAVYGVGYRYLVD